MTYKTDLISTKWASRVGLQPYVNAINMEAMVAFGQFSKPFAVHDFMKAHHTVKDVLVARRTVVEGEHREAVMVVPEIL
nr:hypothetical protein CFP56_48310 [Quercus suber]